MNFPPVLSRVGSVFLLAVAWFWCGWGYVEAAPAGGNPRTTFTNSVGPLPPGSLATAHAVAAANLGETLEIEVPLTMRDYPKLLERTGRGEIVTQAELVKDYLPLPRDYSMVERWLREEGFEITQTDPNRLSIFARGTLAQIQHSFQVPMYKVTVKGRVYNAAQAHPSLPAQIAVPVLGVNGLQPFRQAHKHKVNATPNTANKPPYLVKEVMGAYNGTSLGVTGSGQTIAILIDSVPLNSDLTSFWTRNSIAQSLSNITKIGVNGSTPPDTDGEATLDVEWASSSAPAAQIRVYATGDLSFTSIDKALQRIISDLSSQPAMHQLSISLGLGETYLLNSSELQTESQYFATLASKGVSVFVSSGDAGSNPDDTGHNDSGNPGPLQVEYESSDPSVTGVGGTNLNLNSATGAVTSETAWEDSGGGVSRFFAKPTWQKGTGVPAGTKRFVPDVGLIASPTTSGFFFFQGQAGGVGGTSLSAPIWAGFAALINEARAKHALSSMGLMNPLIYPLIGTTNFRDVTTGSNGAYSAGAGYDRITGVGVPNLSVLVPTLGGSSTGDPTIASFNPTSGAPGTTVTVTGTNLDRATDVKFNGVSATFTPGTATSLTATVPAGATMGPIAVVTSTGTVTSTSNFTVTTATVPNDNFASAQTITGTSGAVSGSNVNATKETGEPDHAGNAGGASIWYRWTAPSAGIYTFDTSGSSFDTLLAVYTGSTVSNLTEVVSNDDAGSGVTSSVSFTATANGVYSIAIDGHNGQTGSTALNWIKNSNAPTINSFSPASGGPGTLVVIDGANLTGVSGVTFSGVAASFSPVSATQITANVPVGAATGVIKVTTAAGGATSTGVFTVTNPPPNDNFANAQALTGPNGMVTGTNMAATRETGEPKHAGNTGGHSVWYTWTAPATKPVVFDTFGSSFDTLLAIYTGSAVNALTQVAADDNAGSGFNSVVTFSATSGTVYHIAVDGNNGVTGNLVLNFNSNIPAPVITSFSPSSGSIGTDVIITGTSLGSVSSVRFNGVEATFSIDSDSQVTATVPSGATSGVISLTNATGTTSSGDSFTVAAATQNDNFANAATITGTSTVTGSNAAATKEAGEPNHAGNAGGASVWWKWTAPASAQYSVTTLGSSFDTVLAVYTGTAVNALSAVASNDDDPNGGHTSSVTFKAVAGTVYRIAVDGFDGVTGDIVLSVLADSSGTIFSTGFESGEGYSTQAALAGQQGWLKDGNGENGVVNGYFSGLGQQGYLGNFDSQHGANSTYVWQPLNYTPKTGDVITFQVTMQIVDSTNRRYDDFRWQVYNQAGVALFGIDFDNSTLEVGYTIDSSTSVHQSPLQFGNSSVYHLQVTMDFANNKWSAMLEGEVLATDQPITTKGSALNLGDIDANWNVFGQSAGNNYLLFDNYSVRNTGNVAPKILLQPSSQTVNQGSSVTLHAVAMGTQPITYQWQKDGATLPGATVDALVLNNVQPADAGSYTVVITNAAGSVTTTPAVLKVNVVQAPNLAPYQPHGWTDQLVISSSPSAMASDATLVAGENLFASFGVVNNGNLAAPSGFHQALFVDGLRVTTVTQPTALAPNASSVHSGISIGALTVGSHQIKVVVDADNAVVESNEGDNSYQKMVTVKSSTGYAVINLTASPNQGGAVSGGGAILKNKSVTVTATPNVNYSFLNWTEGGVVVSTAESYTFKATANRALVANFDLTANIPAVVISSPAGGTTTVQSTVNLAGTASAPSGITKVEWKNDQGGSGTATGTTSWTISAIPLKAGKVNVIRVTATGGNGDPGVASLIITRDAPAAFRGSYTSLLVTGGATPSYVGQATVSVNALGSYSASFYLFGRRSALSGKFDVNGTVSRSIARTGLPPLVVSLTLIPSSTLAIDGTVGDGKTTATFHGVPPAFLTAAKPWPGAARYTLLLESKDSDATAPRGHGYGLLTVSKKGLAVVVGRLNDGTVYSHAGYVAADLTPPFYASLYRGVGYAAGPLKFQSMSTSDVAGPIDFVRPPVQGAAAYPQGFQTRLTATGSIYLPGPSTAPVLAAGNRQARLSDGDLGATVITKTLSLGANGAFAVMPVTTDNFKLSVVRKTGQLSGSFVDPTTNKKVSLLGAVLQKTDTAAGYFVAPNGTGDLEIDAKQ